MVFAVARDDPDGRVAILVGREDEPLAVWRPDEHLDGGIEFSGDVLGLALGSAAGIGVENHQLPLIGLEAWLFLSAVGEVLAVGRELRRAVGREVRFREVPGLAAG